MDGGITLTFAAIFLGAALFASLALFSRQPIIIAYIALGMALGPFGLEIVNDLDVVADAGHIGIIFLLFLLGLDMQPRALFSSLKNASLVALISSAIFGTASALVSYLMGFTLLESAVIGAAMMFSSTIIGIKLLPTTVLHHKHLGEMLIALLLLQDLLAIVVLIVLQSAAQEPGDWQGIVQPLLLLPLLAGACWAVVRWLLLPLIARFDRYHEYIFLVSIGWCLGIAEGAATLGLSAEIGAFVAGVSIATSPIAQYIALNLKPLRDFFLVIFFFSIGAQIDLGMLPSVLLPAAGLATLLLAGKPIVYHALLRGVSERNDLSWNLGFRLGQASEFALLIAMVAVSGGFLGHAASTFIQATTIITLLASSYIVVLNFPTPIAISDRLRRD